ncbi:MAG: hypothetical protein AB1847_15320 [bacterium]
MKYPFLPYSRELQGGDTVSYEKKGRISDIDAGEWNTSESLKAKFMRLGDKLRKMDELIENLQCRLCQSNGEFDEH